MAQLGKTYDPQRVERNWRQFWMDHGYFHATVDRSGTPYTIVIPPPNVTGSLHIGHALNNTIQDMLIRWRRMQGYNTLWVPGTDHAGIATQNVVEHQLMAEGKSREALGRQAFIQRAWEWKTKSGGAIIEQLKRLGASCDWGRLRFTMDEGLSAAVREVFVRLYEDGLIYRGERLINWCPRCRTALSDIEVQHEDAAGHLYHIRYPVVDDPSRHLTVATTRPETMLGDMAVAVHPEDERYNHLIGKQVRLPLTNREIPIVGDPILVSREFGTGAVKITPAHDFNDFDAGERHGLGRIALLDKEACLSPLGLNEAAVEDSLRARLGTRPVQEAREIVVGLLKERSLLEKIEPHKMALGKCYRCKTVVEPMLSPQWFVKIKPLAEPAIQAVEDGRIRFIPETWTNNYLGWMRDIKDWCISRQIWWGHQIPAWYCLKCNEAKPIVARAQPKQCPSCGAPAKELIQDPDVLDTWFSSALWPFSTLGWPNQTPELKAFYPTSTLVTGLDILFFWVARMIMMGLKFTGQVPFRDVYIHALVRDAEGQKMSKSKGNVIDPLSVMDTYGTDAFRFTLASMASPGRDIKLAVERIEGYRNFANKIWNAARFLLLNLEGPREPAPPEARYLGVNPFPDRWVLSRLNRTVGLVNAALEQYRFDQACSHLYHFIWHEYCDWYLELIKPALQDKHGVESAWTRQTLLESFECLLRLLHPVMPFISEEIWQELLRLGLVSGESLAICPYPTTQSAWEDTAAETVFTVLEQFVTIVRAGRLLLNYPPGKVLTVYGASNAKEELALLQAVRMHIETLSRSQIQEFLPLDSQLDQRLLHWPAHRILRLAAGSMAAGLVVEGEVDLHKALDRIKKQKADSHAEAKRLEGRLGSPEFAGKAPAEIVAEHKQRLQRLREEQALLNSSEAQLRAMTLR